MEPLILKVTDDTPQITLNKEDNEFTFIGASLPEDAKEFFKPVMDWIKEYLKNPNPESMFVFNMTYFNTASSKMILDILFELKDAITNNHNIKILWKYERDDEEMLDTGEEFSDIVDVQIEYEQYSLFDEE